MATSPTIVESIIVESPHSTNNDDHAEFEKFNANPTMLNDISSSFNNDWYSTIYHILTTFESLFKSENRRVQPDVQLEADQTADQTENEQPDARSSQEQELIKNSEELIEDISLIGAEVKDMSTREDNELSKRLQARLSDISLKLPLRDQVFLKTMNDQKEEALRAQKANKEQILSLSDKIDNLN